MRYLIYLLVLIIMAIGIAIAAELYLSEPLIIRYGNWSAAPPLSLALGTVAIALLLLFLLQRFIIAILFFPLTVAEWGRRRRRNKEFQLRKDILYQSVYANRQRLKKLLNELAETDAAAAWRAAQVAEETGDAKNAKRFLQLAENGGDAVISAAAKAKRCMHEQRLTEADTILKGAGAPQSAILLVKQYYDLCLLRQDWNAALSAALQLRNDSALVYGNCVQEVIRRFLRQAKSASEVSALWRDSVSAADKKQPELVALYLTTLWRLGDENAATEGLNSVLKQHPEHIDILQAVVHFGSATQREMAFRANEKAVDNATANDVERLRLVSELAQLLDLPGKVRQYGQMLAALRVKPGTG